jgi:hypothetical protein
MILGKLSNIADIMVGCYVLVWGVPQSVIEKVGSDIKHVHPSPISYLRGRAEKDQSIYKSVQGPYLVTTMDELSSAVVTFLVLSLNSGQ